MKKHIVRGNPYFPKTVTKSIKYPKLTEDISTDVLIVGGGVTGLLSAYYFNKNNIKTTVIEKNQIASGSTSITTALLQYELDELLIGLEKILPLDKLIEGYKLGYSGLDEVKNICSELNIDCDLRERNSLFYTNEDSYIPKLEYEYKTRKDYGFKVDFIDESNSKFEFPLKAGVLSLNGGLELNPVKFTYSLGEKLSDLGVSIFENTEIIEVTHYDDYVVARTKENSITCKKLIVATGYDISLFSKDNFSSLYTTYVIVTTPIKEKFNWDEHCLIISTEDPYAYLRTTPDNRIIIGGEDTRFIPELLEDGVAKVKYTKLEKRLREMFPNIEFEIDFKFNGLFAKTKDNLPYIGPDPDKKNIWYCLGYGANGLLFATIGAKLLSELYLGNIDKRLSLTDISRKN